MNTVVTERSHNEEAISQQLNFREYFGELYAPTLRYSCFYLGWVLLACLTVPCLNVVEAAPAKRSMHSTLYHRYIQRIRQQLKKKPRSARLHTVLGRLYQKSQMWKKAEASYRSALRFNRDYPHALVGLAHLALRRRLRKTAQTLVRRVLSRHPRLAPALALRSELFRHRARLAKTPKQRKRWLKRAEKSLLKAIRYSKQAHTYHYRLGMLYLAMHQYFQAHAQFTMTVRLRPLRPCYKVGLYVAEGMLLRKPQSYQTLKKLLPHCNHPLMSLMAQKVWMAHQIQSAQKKAANKKLPQAIQQLQEALKLAPNASGGYLYLTLLLSQAQRCQEARLMLRKLLARQPGNKEALRLLRHPKALRCGDKPKRRPRARIKVLRVTPKNPQPPSPHKARRKPSK